jgi:ferric enterobactin receptor
VPISDRDAEIKCLSINADFTQISPICLCPEVQTFMKFHFLFIALIASSLFAGAQNEVGGGKITGRVIDSASKAPIEYATISLFSKESKKPINGATTNTSGQFIVTGIKNGIYNLVIESIGYKSHSVLNISIEKKNGSFDCQDILLTKSGSTLQAVTVTAPGLIENKIDKIVFNAEKDLTSQGGVATDLLKKLPQVSVDIDGNVELAGSSSVRFLINGKPSSAFGNNIADVLQSIPASQIKSIELITNPGAKYDAEGLGGIINIILKNNMARGVNGNVSLTAGTRMENGSFNFNARQGNFGVNAFLSGNLRPLANTPSASQRLSYDSVQKTNLALQQDGSFDFKRHGLQSGIGFDWTYKKKNNFSGSLSYSQFGNEGVGVINQSQITTDAANDQNIISDIEAINHSENRLRFYTTDASLNYKRTFEKEDQELNFSVNTSFGTNNIISTSYQFLQPEDSLFFATNSTNSGKERETEIQLDYTQPIRKNIILGIGGKIGLRNINSSSDVYSFENVPKEFLFDSSLSNRLEYNQKVYAAYTEMSFPVFKLFDTKLGVRYERTNINSYFSNAQQQVAPPGYNTVVPSIFFSRKIGDKQTIKLSYVRRIERPDYRDLNPFVNTSDLKNVTRGNPYLRPELGNRVELGYSYDAEKIGTFTITAFYRQNLDDIQPYIVYYPTLTVGDTTYNNIAVTTSENIGTENNVGGSIFSDLHVTSRLSIRTNIFFFERHTINSIDKNYNSNSFNYRLNLNTTYQFKNNLAFEFFGNFNSPRNEAQGKYPSFTSYSFAFRKLLWNKKGSIALTTTNPFNEYVNQRTMLYGPNFTVNSLRKVPFRSVGINFTWKFGKLQFKKEKDETRDLNPDNG